MRVTGWQQAVVRRRQDEWDEWGRDPEYVMWRRSDGLPEPPEAQQAVVAQLLELLAPAPDLRLLDVGCGSGELTRELRPYFRDVTATDLSEAMLGRARQVLEGATLCAAPAHDLPFEDQRFDRALSYSVFQYFPDFAYARQALHELLRVTAPGGIVVIADVPDAAKKHLSHNERHWNKVAPPLELARTLRRKLVDFALGPRIHGFYPMCFFEEEAAAAGHQVDVLPESSTVERGKWRNQVVISKRG
ncbi:MAG: class I SAM-dependent methyltransferase [Armatimonadota bacterium]